MKLLKRVKRLIERITNDINNSLIYKLSKKEVEIMTLKKEKDAIKQNNLIKERRYIDELNIKKSEIRYVDLQMARVMKYIYSARFKKDNDEEKQSHLIELIKGNAQE